MDKNAQAKCEVRKRSKNGEASGIRNQETSEPKNTFLEEVLSSVLRKRGAVFGSSPFLLGEKWFNPVRKCRTS